MSQGDSTSGNTSDQFSGLTNDANPISLVGSQLMNDQPSNQDSNSDQPPQYFQDLLSRLDVCTELVHAELEEYRNASFGSDPSKRTDYLLSVVIPVYNELNTIGRILSRVASLNLNLELVIVDDFSTDGTREILEQIKDLPRVSVILKEKNEGKGAALRTGFEHVNGDYVVVQDADLEYNPSDIPMLIQPLLKGEADVVLSLIHI